MDEARLVALEAKVQELEAMVNLTLRLLSLEKPLAALLERSGASEAEERAVHALVDEVARGAQQGGMYAPTFNGFAHQVYDRFPAMRNNRDFVILLLETLKIERPAYRQLFDYARANGWFAP